MKCKKISPGPNCRRLKYEVLESRNLLAASLNLSDTIAVVPVTDASGLAVNLNVSSQPTAFQSEMTLDVNPTNPLHLAGFSHKFDFNSELAAAELIG